MLNITAGLALTHKFGLFSPTHKWTLSFPLSVNIFFLISWLPIPDLRPHGGVGDDAQVEGGVAGGRPQPLLVVVTQALREDGLQDARHPTDTHSARSNRSFHW